MLSFLLGSWVPSVVCFSGSFQLLLLLYASRIHGSFGVTVSPPLDLVNGGRSLLLCRMMAVLTCLMRLRLFRVCIDDDIEHVR